MEPHSAPERCTTRMWMSTLLPAAYPVSKYPHEDRIDEARKSVADYV